MTDTEPISNTGETGDERSRPSWLKLALRSIPLLALIIGGITISILGFGEYVTLSSIVESRTTLIEFVTDRPLLTVAIYVGLYIVAVVFSIPGGFLLTVVGGVLFGGVLGGLITTIAAAIGSVLVFLIARTALGDWLRRRAENMGPRIAGLSEGFRTNAFYVIVVIRLVPVMPFWASNAIPALFGVSLRVFFTATLVGLLPWTVSFAFFGSALDSVIAAQEIANPGCADAGTCELDFSAMTSGPIITGVIIALVSLIPVIVHLWSRRRAARLAR